MKEMLLLFVAISLLYLLLPIVIVYMIFKYLSGGNGRMVKTWACKTARSIDVFANVEAQELFNDILIKTGGYKFGNKLETISVASFNSDDLRFDLLDDLEPASALHR